ncbi:SAM-dependent DNA methyltransferase [Candidatus Poribacteria bacterium]|nr:SAM-dependent DNA methyltransferase [Candidatus Poribacteria bacterium]
MKSKRGKISNKTKTEIFKASVFDASAYKTERTCVAKATEWINRIADEKRLDIGPAEVETRSADDKYPDIVIYENPRSQNILCVAEFKSPYFDPFDDKELIEPARLKATYRKAKYFVTSNFKTLIWFNTEKVNAMLPEEEQIVEKYNLSGLENLDDIDQIRYSEPIKRGLEKFLTKLYAVHTGGEPEPKQAIDELLIFRLQERISVLSTYYRRIIDDKCHKEPSFAKELKNWFIDQSWSFAWQPSDFDKAARQTAYLLVNKILFYNLLQAKRPHELAPLEIPQGLLKGAQLQKILQSFFDEALKIDYQTIYTTDFIDTVAFPDAKEVVSEIEKLVNILKRYDFSKLGYDVIGRIFERLIPQDERHNLGQYFTSPDVVDLILKFCLHHEDDKILDPACGAGTFLVRAYQHKKVMNLLKSQSHEDILETLWGNDIAKFPAHLATINLAINDLSVDKNYPNILQEDFFALLSQEAGFELPEKWRIVRAKTLGVEDREVKYPRWFDAVVGNPPYTRQEEISEISHEDAEYKEKLIEKALLDLMGNKIAEIGKRAGIHTYFFVHGTKFLKDGGYFGFIVSESWLDVDYGKGLQEFFLKNYKIIAIIESKVERWFEEADINTCIVILQKSKDKKERDENLVRFVYLKKKLRYFIPPAQDMWEKQVERLKEIDKLKKTILAHDEFYENEDLRIFPKSQKELWNEGFEPPLTSPPSTGGKYVGAKWGKYLRAPEIFFKILEKGKDKFVPLKEVAEVRFGIKTGANEFFYLTENEIKERGIEEEFWMHKDEKGNWVPNYVIKSPRECKSIVVNPKDLKYRVLMIHKDKEDLKDTNVLKYIEEGERKGFHKRPTCAGRGERWYDLGIWEKPDIVWSDAYNDRYGVYNTNKTWADKRFFYITLHDKTEFISILAFLNSTIIPLMIEIDGITNLGEGAVYTNVYWLEKLFIPVGVSRIQKLRNRLKIALDNIQSRKILSVFDEIAASSPEEVSLDKVKPDRRELDKIIMGEILGLTDEKQLEVYRAVVDLVKSRIEKAKSVDKKKKTKEGIDVDALVEAVMDRIGDETIGKFYREKILSQESLSTKTLAPVGRTVSSPHASIKIEQDLLGWKLYSVRRHIECRSQEEARYLKIFLEAGLGEVKIPEDDEYLKSILPELEALKTKADKIVSSYLESIVDSKTRAKIEHQLWAEMMKSET